jgi:signal peptidase II
MTSRDWGLVAAAIALIADQGSKILMLYAFGFADLAPGTSVVKTPVLDLVMAWNPGISFSFLAAYNGASILTLIVLAAVAIGGLSVWLWRSTRAWLAIGLGLVVGGALGNLVDRIVYGRVADFFDLHAFGRIFFICNVADIAITAGVLCLLYDLLRDTRVSVPRVAK